MSATPVGWVTALTSIVDDRTTLHGYDLLDLAERLDFTSITYLTWTGRLPREAEKSMLDALLGCVVVHGVAPTGAIARGLVRSGVPTQVGVAGALLSIGDTHGGAGEKLGAAFDGVAANLGLETGEQGTAEQVSAGADSVMAAFEGRVPGLGHAAHPEGDPRSVMLMERARELGVSGFHVEVMVEIERRVAEKRGKPIPCNVDGAMTAILCDLGIDWRYSRVLLMCSRAVGLGAQVIEEQTSPTPRWRDALLPHEIYVGPPLRELPASGGQ